MVQIFKESTSDKALELLSQNQMKKQDNKVSAINLAEKEGVHPQNSNRVRGKILDTPKLADQSESHPLDGIRNREINKIIGKNRFSIFLNFE